MSAHNHFTVKKTAHPILKKLGDTIRSFRVQHGLSQEALAELAGIDRSYMSGIERGLRNLSVLHAIKLSKALQVAVHELFDPSSTSYRSPLEPSDSMRARHERGGHVTVAELSEAMRLEQSPSMLIGDENHVQTRRPADWRVGQYLSLG